MNLGSYGLGNDGDSSEYISLAESWAEHMAHTMCDLRYGANSTDVVKQGFLYMNGGQPDPTLTSHLNALEAFDPNRPLANAPFRWIPEGLYYDLIDVRNETSFPVEYNVSNFTNQQIFNALDSDVRSMPEYREINCGKSKQPNGAGTKFICTIPLLR